MSEKQEYQKNTNENNFDFANGWRRAVELNNINFEMIK